MKVLENLSIQENLFPLNHTEESKLRGVSPDKELLTMQSYLSDSCKIGQTSNYQICALLITLWSAFLSSEASAPTPFSSVHRDICSSSCWQSLQFTCLCGFPAHGILNLIFSCQSISCPIFLTQLEGPLRRQEFSERGFDFNASFPGIPFHVQKDAGAVESTSTGVDIFEQFLLLFQEIPFLLPGWVLSCQCFLWKFLSSSQNMHPAQFIQLNRRLSGGGCLSTQIRFSRVVI